MKKLLAMILCVMMFVSVLSNVAFAEQNQPFPTSDATAKWSSLASANKAVSNSKKNIEYMYGALAADNAVFGTIKAMDGVVVDLAKGLFADLTDGYSINVPGGKVYFSQDLLEKNTKAYLRNIIGGEIANYMNDHLGSYAEIKTHLEIGADNKLRGTSFYDAWNSRIFTSDNGTIYAQNVDGDWFEYTGTKTAAELDEGYDTNWVAIADPTVVKDVHYDPVKYANNFATAVTKAMSSEKGAANLSAVMYRLMQAKVASDLNDKLDDLATDIANWEDGTLILDQYGFADFDNRGGISLDPYALIDPYNLPKASAGIGWLTVDDGTAYYVPDFPADPW